MAREFQSVQVKYWECARKKGLTMNELAVEFFLMTFRECGPSGLLICSPSTIAFYTGSTDRQVRVTLKSLETKDRLKSSDGDWLFVLGKWEHERTKSEQVRKCVARELETAPDSLKQCFLDTYSDTQLESLLTFSRESIGSQTTRPPIGIVEEKEKDKNRDTRKISHGAKVKLTKKEYQNLCNRYTKSALDEMIEKMNNWAVANGKKYDNYNQAIHNWFKRRDDDKENSSSKSFYICPKQCDGSYTINDLGKPCPTCESPIMEFEKGV